MLQQKNTANFDSNAALKRSKTGTPFLKRHVGDGIAQVKRIVPKLLTWGGESSEYDASFHLAANMHHQRTNQKHVSNLAKKWKIMES